MKKVNWEILKNEDLNGKVFVIPTDTIYGFSALYNDKNAIQKIYKIKKRDLSKKMIILISKISDLDRFEVELSDEQKYFLERNWPERVSFLLKNKKGESFAFRMPAKEELLDFLKKVGPIVSTSFNLSGKKNAVNLDKIDFFKDIDYYIDEGELEGNPSLLLEFLR